MHGSGAGDDSVSDRPPLGHGLHLHEEPEVVGSARLGVRTGHVEAPKRLHSDERSRDLAVHVQVAGFDGTRLESFVTSTKVTFRDISHAEAEAYWQTGEPADKAGGYGIQGIGSIFAEGIEGSYSAVVGLPLQQTEALLQLLNIDTWSVRIDGRRTPD